MRNLTARFLKLLASIAIAGMLVAACGGDDDADGGDGGSAAPSDEVGDPGDGGDGAAESGEVNMVDFTYDPDSLTVAPGAEVTFTNGDSTAHTATADDNSFSSGSIQGGEDGTIVAPDTPGEYPYFCAFHPFMKGTLVVE